MLSDHQGTSFTLRDFPIAHLILEALIILLFNGFRDRVMRVMSRTSSLTLVTIVGVVPTLPISILLFSLNTKRHSLF